MIMVLLRKIDDIFADISLGATILVVLQGGATRINLDYYK